MALEGTLRDFSFADILQLISLQRKTGVLTLKGDDNVVTISFLEGRIVGANSLNQHLEDRLGLILLKQGVLTEADLEAALRVQEETLQRLGRILIDRRVVGAEYVQQALQQQILQIIYRVFRWDDGEYQFSQETDIDFDRDLLSPMATDSIIMEGARMTDEWPFIHQKLPNRSVVFIKVDPSRRLEVVEEEDDLDDIGFSFTDSPEEEVSEPPDSGDRITRSQAAIYGLVSGRDSVDEIILDSPLIEFETCRSLVDLLAAGLIRPARPEEVAQRIRRDQVQPEKSGRPGVAVPWLALPFLILFGLSITVMTRNPLNPTFSDRSDLWARYVRESVSWFRIQGLSRAAEISYYLNGLYPEDLQDLLGTTLIQPRAAVDPWGDPYRLVVRGNKLLVTGSDASGQSVPMLMFSRSLAWEASAVASPADDASPGVILME